MERIYNWTQYPQTDATIYSSENSDMIPSEIWNLKNIIARGNGKSYSDCSLNDNVFSTLKMNRVIDFNVQAATITCESGILLSNILRLIIPEGFFLPVVPGTKYITLGGAIAADVHGKNHFKNGSFSNCIVSFELLTASGEKRHCSRRENYDLFKDTCGGMGLTGIILSATIKLMKIETAFIKQKTVKTENLAGTLRIFSENPDATYRIAWIDVTASKTSAGKGIVLLGEHANRDSLNRQQCKKPLQYQESSLINIPDSFPEFLLNKYSIRLFNKLYYLQFSKSTQEQVVNYERFFFPLDSISNWNRLYGRKGFLQYQAVFPLDKSYEGINRVLIAVLDSNVYSLLGVIKYFSDESKEATMSFPFKGYSIALDFKYSGEALNLFNFLDKLVLEYGGRLYLAKDSRMPSEFFHKSYKSIIKHPAFFQSMQSVRLKY